MKLLRKGFNESNYTEVELDNELANAILDKSLRDRILNRIDDNLKEGTGFCCRGEAVLSIELTNDAFKKYFTEETVSIRKHYESIFRKYEYSKKEQYYYEYELVKDGYDYNNVMDFQLTEQFMLKLLFKWSVNNLTKEYTEYKNIKTPNEFIKKYEKNVKKKQ